MKFKIIILIIINISIHITKSNENQSIKIELIPKLYDASMKIFNKEKIVENIYLNLTNTDSLSTLEILKAFGGKKWM